MIALVRHPPVEAGGRCYGRLDLPVKNLASIGELASRIANLKAETWTIWTSPARRCRMVAQALGPHRLDNRLQELDFGAWEGLAWDDVPRAGLDAWAADPWGFAPPGGESGAGLVARVRSFMAECQGGNHVIITHGGPLKVLGAILNHVDIDLLAPAPPPGSITISPPSPVLHGRGRS